MTNPCEMVYIVHKIKNTECLIDNPLQNGLRHFTLETVMRGYISHSVRGWKAVGLSLALAGVLLILGFRSEEHTSELQSH